MATYFVINLNDSGEGSFRQALDDVNNAGHTIEFQVAGTINVNSQLNVYNSNVIVNGNNVTFDGQNLYRIFNVGNITGTTINNCNFQNARATQAQSGLGAGGAIRCASNSEIVLNNCTFTNNVCETWGGGAIRITSNSTLTLNNCTFTGNTCEANDHNGGGAIASHGYCELDISDCTFTNNSGMTGGAINAGSTWSKYRRCTFTGNNTDFYLPSGLSGSDTFPYGAGGAIYTDGIGGTDSGGGNPPGREGLIEDCTFENNRAFNKGGALFWFGFDSNGETSIIRRCTFRNNTVKFDRRPSNPSLEKSQGGALRVNDLPTTVDRCLFESNSCLDTHATHDEGGAIFVGRADAQLTISNSIFTGNTGTNGASIAAHNPTNIIHCTFIGSSITDYFLDTNPQRVMRIDVQNSIFSGSSAIVPVLVSDNPTLITGGGNIEHPIFAFSSSTNTDPNLDSDFYPQEGSPAVDAAPDVSPGNDYYGVARGDNPDIGAVESVNVVALPPNTVSYTVAIPFKSSVDNQTIHGLAAIELVKEDFPGFVGDGNVYLPARDITSKGAVVSINNPLFVDRPRYALKAIDITGSGTHTIVTPSAGTAIAITSLDFAGDIPITPTIDEVAADDSVTTALLKLPSVRAYSKSYPYPVILTPDYLLKLQFPENANVKGSIQYFEVG